MKSFEKTCLIEKKYKTINLKKEIESKCHK